MFTNRQIKQRLKTALDSIYPYENHWEKKIKKF